MNIVVEKRCDKKLASRFFVRTFFAVAILWALSFTPWMIPAFWQGIAVIYFGLATLYGIKYHMTEYTYTLTDDGFVIVKTIGQKSQKVCHIDVPMMTDLYSPDEWKVNKKNRQITAVYNYNASASPVEYYVLIFEMDSKKTAVMFEGSAEMRDAIMELIRGSEENQ